MFICDRCGKPSRPARTFTEDLKDENDKITTVRHYVAAEKPVRVVVERREKVYPVRPKAMKATADQKYFKTVRISPDGYIDDPGGKGWEIAREEQLHADCC